MLISASGTRLGIGAMFCAGVPKIVARSAAESAKPAAGPGAAGAAMTGTACDAAVACVAPGGAGSTPCVGNTALRAIDDHDASAASARCTSARRIPLGGADRVLLHLI
jgi:hypothetical protein